MTFLWATFCGEEVPTHASQVAWLKCTALWELQGKIWSPNPEIAAKKSENFEILEENIENIGYRNTILNHTINLKTKIQKGRGKIRKISNSQNRKTELIQL